jgi:UDP-N-acetylmuramate-alanine ligase
LTEVLGSVLAGGDIVVTLGAGSIGAVAATLAETLVRVPTGGAV